MELLRSLSAHTLFQVMGDLIGIDEVYIHPTGYVARCHAIESVCVDERVALHHLHTVLESLRAQLFIVVNLRCFNEEVAAYHTVHQHGDTAMLARLADKLSQIVVERRARICMSLGLWLLVVVSELDDDIVARLHALEHFFPVALVDE